MKKYYILFSLCIISVLELSAQFQTYPKPNPPLFSWAFPYDSYTFGNMQFRLKTPNGFDANGSEKYPLILFLHGAGEGGTENEKQLIHGGERTLNAIIDDDFPGIALYPQTNTGRWSPDKIDDAKAIVDQLIENYNVDPNRIYVHGLSGGADGTWRFAYAYPELVAAMHPMSGVFNLGAEVGVTQFIPTWLAQGGRDRAPTPDDGNTKVEIMREAGANIRYSYQPNTGHGTWNTQYRRSDFFSWFLEKSKTDITVLFGQSSFCVGDIIDITLGVTAGFNNYEWAKDNTSAIIASGVGTNTINVTEPGLYFVRFQRGSEWTEWSEPVDVNRNLGAAPATSIVTGNQSLNLPSLSGAQSVEISSATNEAFYQWLRGMDPIDGASNSSYIASDAGNYTLSVRPQQETGFESDGVTPTEFRAPPQPCFSDPSDPVVVTTQNGLNVPAKPVNFSANVLDDNSITINWNDNATDELAFELYRSTQSGAAYILVERIPATTGINPQVYIDQPVMANTTYYYRMRAVNNSGGSPYTDEVSVSTAVDNEAPSAPILSLAGTTNNSVSLNWVASNDNVGVTEYEVYRNNNLVATVTGTSFTNSPLATNQTFSFMVKAKDASGNVSVNSNQITARTINSGLSYSYYHHGNLSSVNQIETNGTLIRTGDINNFDITIRDQDNRFAFVFEGYVLIPTAGNYTFYTSSDDGSRLFINGNSVVNNDGLHGCQERNGQVTLPAGFAHIRVPFFENGGGECLQVRWQGPGISKQLIPDEVLFQDQFVPVGTPLAPSNLSAVAQSYSQIDLSWQDNSANENAFEIYRSLNENSGYQVVQVVDANITAWSDTGLAGGTNYFYRVVAINFNGSSEFAGPASTTTLANPPPPQDPSNLLLSVVNTNDVSITWADNSDNELGFEIYRSTSNVTSTFTLIHTTDENIGNIGNYVDTQTSGNSTYYYRIRAKGIGSFSGYTDPIANITTLNTAPSIESVIPRSVKFGTTLIVDLIADDPDGDPLTFSFTNPLPAFMTFSDNNYGQGQLTISPAIEETEGPYIVEFTVNDGFSYSAPANFTITVSDNNNPSIDQIPDITMRAGFTEQLYVFVDDELASALIYSTQNLPDFVNFAHDDSGNVTFTISPNPTQSGTFSNIKLLVDDGQGGFAEESFNIIVEEVKTSYSVYLNFGNVQGPSPWNNTISGDLPSGLFDLISSDDISRDIVFRADNFNDWNSKTFDGSSDLNAPLFPAAIGNSYIERESGGINFHLSNLNPGLSYDLTFFAGHTGDKKTSRFIINNGAGQNLDPDNNTTNTVTFTDVSVNSSNEIYVRVSPRFDGTNFIINSLVVNAYFEDGLAPIAPSDLVANALSSTEVELTWQDNSNNEQRFDILRSNVPADASFVKVGSASANQTSFIDDGLTGSTTYYYKVRAFNSSGSANSEVGIATTLNSAPVIAEVSDITMKVGEAINIPLSATDTENDPIDFTALNLPNFATLVDNGDGTGELLISPQAEDLGFYEGIIIEAKDIFGKSSTTEFFISVIDAAFDNTVYINFSNNTTATFPWNNITTLPNLGNVRNGFKNSNNENSDIGIRVGANWTSVDNTGIPVSYTNDFPYDQNVLVGAWKSDSVEWNEGTQNVVLEIIELDPNAIYNIDLIAATNRWKKSLADYNFQGNIQRINPLDNEGNTYSFNSLSPNALGVIELLISGTELSEYIYLNALIIKEVDNSAALPLAPTQLKAAGKTRESIELNWVDNSFNETGFEIYYTDEIGKIFTYLGEVGANIETYTHTGLVTDDHFIYKVQAINANGTSSYSEEAAAITLHHQIKVNINTPLATNRDAPSPWNNTRTIPPSGGSVTFDPLIDEDSQATPEILSLDQFGTGGANTGGFETGNNTGVYHDNVIQAYYFAETNDIPVIFKLDNLNQDFNYDFTFFASEGFNLNPVTFATAISEFTIGNETKILLADYNSSETVSIQNVSPDIDSSISFELTSSAALNSRFGFINAFVVDVYTPIDVAFDNINPASPKNLQAVDITDISLELIWDVATDNVGLQGYEVFMNGNLINTISVTSLIVENLSPAFEYIFSVRAVDRNNNKSGFSNELVVNTLPPAGDFTTYYSNSSGDLNDVTTWGTVPGGSGASPADFGAANLEFVLDRNATLNADWSISGTGSRLIVADNVDLTLGANFTGTISALSNASVNINVDAAPDFIEMHPTSMVSFNAPINNIPAAKYGNLSLGGGTGSTKQFSAGNVTIEGTLNVVDGVTMNGVDPNGTTVVAKGPVAFHGIGAGAQPGQMLSLVMAGTGSQQIETFGENINLYSLQVREGAEVTFNTGSPAFQISLGNAVGGGITIEDGASLDIGAHNLVINGRGVINPENQTGRIRSSKGSLEIHSTSTLTSHLYFEDGSDTLNTLIADMVNLGKVEINSPLHIAQELEVRDGIVDARGNLTMVSSAAGTAYISQIQNRGEIQGTIKAQRFVSPPSSRMYRYFGSMVQNAEVVDWQDHIAITGAFTGSSTGSGLGTNASVFYYDETTLADWMPYPTTTNQELMEAGKGFAVFTRDLSNPLTLELTGEPVQGDFQFDLVAAGTNNPNANEGIGDGWNLIANPYQSPIQWGSTGWTSNNLSPILSIWDADAAGGGKYFYYEEGVVGDYAGEVAIGQGFWVQAIAANPQLSISETAKLSSNTVDFYRDVVEEPVQFTLRLAQGNKEDRAFIRYSENGSQLYDGAIHGRKRANAIFNISTASADGVDLAINHLPNDFCRDSIAIVTSNLTPGNYQLSFEKLETFQHNEEFILIDHFAQTEVNINSETSYAFEVSNASGPSGVNRFALIIQKPDLELDKTVVSSQNRICESDELPFITIQNAQKGVKYTLWMNEGETFIEAVGQGADLDIALSNLDLVYGENSFKIQAAFGECAFSTLTDSVTIDYISLPVTESSIEDLRICVNESALIAVNPTESGLLFKWYVDELADEAIFESMDNIFATPELTASTTYYYSVVNSNGCESAERQAVNVIVEELEKPVITVEENMLQSSSESGNQWYFNGNPIADATGSSLEISEIGTYSLSVSNGVCEVFSEEFEYVISTNNSAEDFNLQLYPNPADKDLNIVFNQVLDENVDLKIIDLTGREVHNSTLKKGSNQQAIEIDNLASGTYIVQLIYHKKPYIHRLIVN